MPNIPESVIRESVRAIILTKLNRRGITPDEGKDVLEDVPEELLSEVMDDAEAAILTYLDNAKEVVEPKLIIS